MANAREHEGTKPQRFTKKNIIPLREPSCFRAFVVNRWDQRTSKTQANNMKFSRLVALIVASASWQSFAAPQPPETSDPGVKVSLFAAEPQVNTPIGAAVDAKG